MKPQRQVEKRHVEVMGDDPLAADAILERFYKPVAVNPVNDAAQPALTTATPTPIKSKPTHYKVVCISLYNEDIENLERMVAELKSRGHTKANKSQLIRAALAQVDLGKIPKGF
jgi:cobalamin biosynthesis protein CobD/CbiB